MTGAWRSQGKGITRKLALSLLSRDGIAQWNQAKGWTFEGQLRLWGLDETLDILEREAFEEGEPDSPADFAGRIIEQIGATRVAIEQGNADLAARYALGLGATIAEFKIKLRDEALWSEGPRGIAVRKGGKKGAEALWGTPAETAARRERLRQDFEASRAAGMTKMEAYAATARAHSVGIRSVQRAMGKK